MSPFIPNLFHIFARIQKQQTQLVHFLTSMVAHITAAVQFRMLLQESTGRYVEAVLCWRAELLWCQQLVCLSYHHSWVLLLSSGLDA